MLTRRWLTATQVALALALGCSGSGQQERAGREWQSASAAHGFAYVDETPSGKHLRVIISEDRSDLCALFDGKHEALTLNYLKLQLPGIESGTYAVGTSEAGAEVAHIETVSGTTKSRSTAVSGRVDVSLDRQGIGTGHFDIDVEFPLHSATEIECSGAASAGGEVIAKCTCQREDGTRFACDNGNGTGSCCDDEVSATTQFKLTVQSAYCPQMCSQVAGLDLCER